MIQDIIFVIVTIGAGLVIMKAIEKSGNAYFDHKRKTP